MVLTSDLHKVVPQPVWEVEDLIYQLNDPLGIVSTQLTIEKHTDTEGVSSLWARI